MFQSLFLWNSRPDARGAPLQRRARLVSILVFVELAPGHSERERSRRARRVSILVFVELAPGQFVEEGHTIEEWMFQSLFLWNSRPDLDDDFGHSWRILVSILVFVELAPGRHVKDATRALIQVSILVFVELAPGRYSLILQAPLPECFNPCFCGTRARTRTRSPSAMSGSCFNPCFCGTRARTVRPARVPRRSEVSILVFVELAPGRGSGASAHGSVGRFQSLFLWNSRPDVPAIQGSSSRSRVSILVFVELAPGRYRERRAFIFKFGFNPCFCGTRARTPVYDVGRSSSREFQSLFLWNSRPDGTALRAIPFSDGVSILVFVELAPGLQDRHPKVRSRSVSILVFVELAPGRNVVRRSR